MKVKGFDIWLMLLVFLLTSVCAVVLPPREAGPRSFSKPFRRPSNLTTQIPPDPPGFAVGIDFAWNIPINPLSLYSGAIWLMYMFSIRPWAEHVNLTNIATLTYPDLAITAVALKDNALTNGHCILALHKVVSAIYGPPHQYDYVVAVIILQGSHIGQITIDNTEEYHDTGKSGNDVHDVHVSSTQPPAFSNPSLALDASGTIIDPENNALRITYHYDGRYIPSAEIFTAAIDGLTSLAPYSERSNECGSMTGISGSGTVDFHVRSINPGVKITTCLVLKRALVFITLWLMAPAKRFGELDFTVRYNGVEVAMGYVYLSRTPGVEEGHSNITVASH